MYKKKKELLIARATTLIRAFCNTRSDFQVEKTEKSIKYINYKCVESRNLKKDYETPAEGCESKYNIFQLSRILWVLNTAPTMTS